MIHGWNCDSFTFDENVNHTFEEAKEGDDLRQLAEHLRQTIKTLKFVFEVDGKLKVDRSEFMVDAQESLGHVGTKALGSHGFGMGPSDEKHQET